MAPATFPSVGMLLVLTLHAASAPLCPPPAPVKPSRPNLVQAVLIELELMDRRQIGYLASGDSSWSCSLEYLYSNLQTLHDAPWIEEVERFPNHKVASEHLLFATAFKEYVEYQYTCNLIDRHTYHDILAELEDSMRPWYCLRTAADPDYLLPWRRDSLKALRTVLGNDAYYRGILPPVVPLHRFSRIP